MAIIASFSLVGCSATKEQTTEAGARGWQIPGIYRIPVQQGNLISQEMVNDLKLGMTKQQVRYLLGTPLLIDIFRDDRWEYLYTNRSYTNKNRTIDAKRQHLRLLFKNDRLQKIAGDIHPQNEEAAKQTKEKNNERTITIPANAPHGKHNIGFLEKARQSFKKPKPQKGEKTDQ